MAVNDGSWIGNGVPKTKRNKKTENVLGEGTVTVKTPDGGSTVLQGPGKYSVGDTDYNWGEKKRTTAWTNPTKVNGIAGKDYGQDYSSQIRMLMDIGGSSASVRSLLYDRNKKINENPELEAYRNDGVTREALQYIMNKESYESKRQKDIDSLMDKIQSRKAFSYDPESDPLYKNYRTQALERGATAVDDTLARAAQMGGGMNSYAITAAQQTNNAYNQQINDVIPQLYQLAYEKYLNEGQENYNILSALQGLDETGYARHMDDLNRDMYYDELSYNRNQADKEWAYNTSQNEQSKAYELLMTALNAGIKPTDTLISQAGMDKYKDDILNLYQMIVNEMYQTGGVKKNSSLGTGSGYDDIYDLIDDETPEPKGGDETEDKEWVNGMKDLGLGLAYDPILLTELEEAGAIYEANGHLYWADGWNAQNYIKKMSKSKTLFGL